MRFMLLGYIFEPTPYTRAPGKRGSHYDYDARTRKTNLTGGNKID